LLSPFNIPQQFKSMIEILNEIFQRELQKLNLEIESFKEEGLLLKVSGELKNSAGNLCLHLCGNLQHFIGAELGKTGYVRNRDSEFSLKNIPKAKLLDEIRLTKETVTASLHLFSETDLEKIYPQNILGKDVTVAYFLIHLLSHLDYHLGQINYLRRILS